MTNLDLIKAERSKLVSDVVNAMNNTDNEKFETETKAALEKLADSFYNDAVMAIEEFKATNDKSILAQRGVNALTSEEEKYWNSFILSAKNTKTENTAASLLQALPITFIDRVMEDVREQHELLEVIDFMPTKGSVKIYINAQGAQRATWGALNTAITTEFEASIGSIDIGKHKLSAFIYITEDMLDLGPQWIDAYVRTMLAEAIAYGIEDGVISGNGISCPVGMIRDFTQAKDPSTGYPKKSAVAINDFGKSTYANLCTTLSKTPTNRSRKVSKVVLIVNPVDYLRRVMVNTQMLTPMGSYVSTFPIPTKVIQSSAVTEGEAVFGLDKAYIFGLAANGNKKGNIESSDEFKFLDDLRTYKVKLYGDGRAKDINCYTRLDITGVKETLPVIETTDHVNTDLVSLTIGAISLSPTFSRVTTSYTGSTTTASNKITAVAKDGDATITIKNGSTTVNNGANATFTDGANTVTVKVANGGEEKTYTVVITKS